MPSPLCTVQDGAGTPQATTNGVDVTAGNTITVQLQDLACRSWAISIVGWDDAFTSGTVPALTVNTTTKTATFTAPAGPWALNLQSVVDGGKDLNGTTQASYTSSIGIYCTASGSLRLFFTNERDEGSSAYGWITKINAIIRALSSGSSTSGRVQTTNATPTTVATIAVPDFTSMTIEFYAQPKKVGAANRATHFRRQRVYRQGGGPTTWGTSPEDIGTDANGETWTTDFSISGNNVLCRVTGQAATTIDWTFEVKTIRTTTSS